MNCANCQRAMGDARRAVVLGFMPQVSSVQHGLGRHAPAQDAKPTKFAIIKHCGARASLHSRLGCCSASGAAAEYEYVEILHGGWSWKSYRAVFSETRGV